MAGPDEPEVYDVAVVGFGPTGAVAAALLGLAGLKVWVCDRSPEVYDLPRAIALDHEILRVFQQIGVIDEVMPHVEPFTPSEYYGVDGQLIKRLTMISPPYPLGYTPSNVFSQPPVEAALRRRVSAMSTVRVELGVEVTSVSQDADRAQLNVTRRDGSAGCIDARYVVGCDGAWSLVRRTAGLQLQDLVFDEPWLVVDVLVNERGLAKLPKTSVQYCEPERPSTLVIGPKNHRRWEISLKEGEDPKVAATPERTWELLSRWITPDDGELWRQASYRFHALVAERWRNGRLFIAGDAAHQQPPFLGQGMCQGVRDAANLAWKLASVLKGEVGPTATEALLDSYGDERKAHVRELTSRIKGIGGVICERDARKARERDRKLLTEAGGTVKDTPRQEVLPKLETGVLSSLAHAAVGSIFPQPWLLEDGKCARMDDVAGYGWRLVLSPSLVTPSASPDLTAIRIGGSGSVEADRVAANWFDRHQCGAALVRPDHYVYAVASDDDQLASMLADWRHRCSGSATAGAWEPRVRA